MASEMRHQLGSWVIVKFTSKVEWPQRCAIGTGKYWDCKIAGIVIITSGGELPRRCATVLGDARSAGHK